MFKKLFTFSMFFFLFYIFNVSFSTKHNDFISFKQASALDNTRKINQAIANRKIPEEMLFCVAIKNNKGNILYPPKSRSFNGADGGILLPAQLVGLKSGSYHLAEPFLGTTLALIIGVLIGVYLGTIITLNLKSIAAYTATMYTESVRLADLGWKYLAILILHIGLFLLYSFHYVYFFRNIAEIGQSMISKIQNAKAGDDDTDAMADFVMIISEIFGVSSDNIAEMYKSTSSISNIVKDKELQTNSYCYAINGPMEDSLNPENITLYPEIPYLDNNYNQYPIYPMKTKVVNGQCDPAPLLDNLGFNASNILNPFDSKCSYSYNTANLSCVTQNIPIMVIGEAQKMAISIACEDLFSINPLTDTLYMIFSIVMDVVGAVFSPITLDPLMFYDYYAIHSIPTSLLMNFIMFIQAIFDAVNGGMTPVKMGSYKFKKEASEKAQKKVRKKVDKMIAKIKDRNVVGDPQENWIKDKDGNSILEVTSSAQFANRISICLTAQAIASGIRFGAGQLTLVTIQTATKDTLVSNRNTKYGIKNIKFCGHNFYSYKGITKKDEETIKQEFKTPEKQYEALYNSEMGGDENVIYEYFERGVYDYSYSACLVKCSDINTQEKQTACKACLDPFFSKGSSSNNEDYKEDLAYLMKDDAKINSVKNKFYREFLASGMEYKIPININNEESSFIFPKNACIDPRIEEEKGFKGIEQRYYFRGNEEANFECDRFMFYKNQGCVLNVHEIEEAHLKEYFIKISNQSDGFYVLKDELEYEQRFALLNQYKEKCIGYFNAAYQCCLNRTEYAVCLADDNFRDETPEHTKNYSICNAEEEKAVSGSVTSSSIFTLVMDAATAGKEDSLSTSGMFYGGKCKIGSLKSGKKTQNIDKIHFNVIRKSYENTTGEVDPEFACVFSDNLCPYNFRLNGGLNYAASYCDSGDINNEEFGAELSDSIVSKFKENRFTLGTHADSVDSCVKGMFNKSNCVTTVNGETPKNLEDLVFGNSKIGHGFAFAKIASDMVGYNNNDYSKITGDSFAKGKIKNFCQFRAHCVKLGNVKAAKEDFSGKSVFTDASCSGNFTSSRNIFHYNSTRLSSNIVECLHETLQNLINGVAGSSKCDKGLKLNEDGYCGSDNTEIIKEKLASSDGGASYINSRYKLLKGNKVPKEMNPLYKIQSNLIQVVRAVLALSIVMWGFKTVVFGEYNLKEYKSYLAYIPAIIKVGLVIYFGFGNAWQEGNYNRMLTNFTTDAYTFVSRLVNSSVNNPHYPVLADTFIFAISNKKITEGTTATTPPIKEINFDLDSIYSLNDIDNTVSTNFKDEFMTFCYKEFSKGKLIKKESKENKKENFIQGHVNNTYYFAEYDISHHTCPDSSFTATNVIKIRSNQGINSFLYFVENLNALYDKANIKHKISYIFNKNFKELSNKDPNIWNKYYDGCYFDEAEYKENKSYLSIFDTVDCKIVRYLGYTGGTAIPKVFMFALACMFTGFIGAFLLGFVMSLIFALFNFILEVIYIFINSFFMSGLLIMMSPVIIPLILFKKTKGIFDNWLNKIIHCALQPILMVASMLIFLSILDIISLGGTEYYNFSKEGRIPILNTRSKDSKENRSYFYIINNPGLIITSTLDVFFKLPFQALGVVSGKDKDGMQDILKTPTVSYLLTILQILVLFKLGDSIIKTSGEIAEKMLGGAGAGGGASISEGMDKGKNAAASAQKAVKPLKDSAKSLAKTGIKRGASELMRKAKNTKTGRIVGDKLSAFGNKAKGGTMKFFSKLDTKKGFDLAPREKKQKDQKGDNKKTNEKGKEINII